MSTVAVITGAGRGMGRACADAVLPLADVLLLVDRDEALVSAVAEELGPGAVAFAADVTDVNRLEELAAEVARRGTLRALAHAAGISPTMADWRRVLTVDLVGSARILEALSPLVGPGSAAVCFSSSSAHMLPAPDPAVDAVLDDPLGPEFLERLAVAGGELVENSGIAYAYAKRGVMRLVRREALRWGPRGGRVCSVSPGIIDTPMGRQEAADQPVMATMTEMSALGRVGRPEELAAVVAFLLSDAASFLTGTDLLVDGGCIAGVEQAMRGAGAPT